MAAGATDRVVAALAAAGVEADVREFPEGTRTAADAAAAVGCDVAQICKSLVFRLVEDRSSGPDRALLVITSGANRVDVDHVASLVGARVEKADAAFVREHTGFAIGGVPPVGHPHPIQTLVDRDLLAFDVVWAAAGTPTAVFPLSPDQLVAITGGRAATVSGAT